MEKPSKVDLMFEASNLQKERDRLFGEVVWLGVENDELKSTVDRLKRALVAERIKK
jgi:hypothetical protein